MGEIKFIGGLVMAMLFIIAIMGYVINYEADNDSAVTISSESSFREMNTSVAGNMSKWSLTDVNESSASFQESTIGSGDEATESGYSFKVGMGTVLNSFYSVFDLTSNYIFGRNPAFLFFLTVAGGLLIYSGIRYVYKTWVGKNPD